jgi:hypothetical protein
MVKNFWTGLLLGVLGTYWFLTQGATVQNAMNRWWARASAPPASTARHLR